MICNVLWFWIECHKRIEPIILDVFASRIFARLCTDVIHCHMCAASIFACKMFSCCMMHYFSMYHDIWWCHSARSNMYIKGNYCGVANFAYIFHCSIVTRYWIRRKFLDIVLDDGVIVIFSSETTTVYTRDCSTFSHDYTVDSLTLQGTNISHLRTRKIIFKSALGGEMLC